MEDPGGVKTPASHSSFQTPLTIPQYGTIVAAKSRPLPETEWNPRKRGNDPLPRRKYPVQFLSGRSLLLRSCEACKLRKAKCDSETPCCGTCRKKGERRPAAGSNMLITEVQARNVFTGRESSQASVPVTERAWMNGSIVWRTAFSKFNRHSWDCPYPRCNGKQAMMLKPIPTLATSPGTQNINMGPSRMCP